MVSTATIQLCHCSMEAHTITLCHTVIDNMLTNGRGCVLVKLDLQNGWRDEFG